MEKNDKTIKSSKNKTKATPAKKKKAQRENTKLNPFYVLEVLKAYSDEDNMLSTLDIIDLIAEAHSLELDKRTIYDSIEVLKRSGYEIVMLNDRRESVSLTSKDQKYFYLGKRELSFQEATLLINAASSFPFLSETMAKRMINTIKGTQSEKVAAKLANLSYINTHLHTRNNDVFKVLTKLDIAIKNNRQVSFIYLHYDMKANLVPRRPEPYVRCPYGMVLVNEHFYLACSCQKYKDLSLYRIDRMKDLKVLEDKIDYTISKADIKRQTEHSTFAMAGEPVTVSMLVPKDNTLDAVFDRFGTDISVYPEDDTHYRVIVHASPKGFKLWALQFVDTIEVLYPLDLRKEIEDSIRNCKYLKND